MAENKINARPTKEFFIHMLTRDIATDRAILDLIDNSIDAGNSNSIENPSIAIVANRDVFSIHDNCGGLDLETAKTYAFRFGRSASNPQTPNSVGQFGVGMKRTLFKIADEFYVESMCNNIAYRVSVSVNEWLEEEGEWEFSFNLLDKHDLTEGQTNIVVTHIKPEAVDLLDDPSFLNRLENEISEAYFKQLHDGLEIKINDRQIKSNDIFIKKSDDLGYIKTSFLLHDVNVTITCGIADRDKEDGGWYVVCNGRLVAAANQTSATGWGQNGVPKYHADYAFFRGLIEFSSADSSKLPWTTTKTGVDQDSKIYKAALHHMSTHMKTVIAFLRERAQETNFLTEGKISNAPLQNAIEQAHVIRIYDAVNTDVFIRPERLLPAGEDRTTSSIQYSVPIKRLDIAKEKLGVTTAREVGEMTFNYYFSYECEDE